MSAGGKRGDAERNRAYWLWRCGWCRRRIGKDEAVLTIPIQLRPEAFAEVTPGGVEMMFLPQAARTVAMIVVAQDSEAKRAGTDAVLQFCSEACARTACDALRRELGAGGGAGAQREG